MLFTPGTPANGGVCGKCGGQGSATCPDGLCNNACRFQNNFDNPTCDSLVPANNPTFCQNTNDQIVAGCQATCNCRAQGLIY
ncbi:hypothetical protein RvY_03663 [Ramazzottius varieornatus]|uniref:Uncharacterized protein n=1 Tax=Ramazzottius varieornatus TaxID=947166 RepID=A0A1D1USI8_RAMVA|nr:hypothetical protein RvY_03663 [Ramazzottius varieornatus]